MEDKLRLNTKLYGFSGIIGRRDYFLNCTFITAISLFFTLPYTMWLNSHAHTYMDLFNSYKMFSQAPFLLKWWFISGVPLTFVLFASNIVRRLNDIKGETNTGLNVFILFVFLLYNLSFFILPFGISCFISFIGFILGFILLLKRGRITNSYPYDFTKEFNWGAFFGTWIWGLFNKSYQTLFMLLLFFTPWSLCFAIYCGLKGNEWAFKNKNWNDISAFNKSQEKQSTIFSIIIPILYIIISILLTIAIGSFLNNANKNNPQALEKTITKLESIYFVSHEITQNESKFYVSSNDWNHYSYSQKKKIFDMAVTLATREREKEYKKQYPDLSQKSYEALEILKTKIYSSETNQLLGEFVMNKSPLKMTLTDYLNAYKFYNDDTKKEYIKNVNEIKKVQTEYIKNTEKTKQAPYFDSYMEELQKEIKKNWTQPKDNKSKRVVVLFSIMQDGTLLNVKVKNSSGIYEVDEEAINAVKLAFPYKVLPSEYKGDRVDVEFTFD